MKKQILLASTFLFTALLGNNQGVSNSWCHTHSEFDKILNSEQQVRIDHEKFKQSVNKFISEGKQNLKAPNKVIPVVFHIVHDGGSENISDAAVFNEMIDLNEDFLKLNAANTAAIAAPFDQIHPDCEIEFKLAKLDPNGNCTNGITRTRSTLTLGAATEADRSNVDLALKNLIKWPNDRYLNIYVVRRIFNGVGGYSYLPGISNIRDGIVILYNQLPSITHEAGHWLGLPHPWGPTNTPGISANCNEDDFGNPSGGYYFPAFNDTPNSIGNGFCNTNLNTCGGDPDPFLTIDGNTLWTGSDIKDNVQNYMDYAFCSAENFTEGQKAMMQASLASSVNGRSNLWSASNLTATGLDAGFSCDPLAVADFDIESQYYYNCTGSSVLFENHSYNASSISYSWEFEGGSPNMSTAENPSVVYNTPGVYKVKLTATTAAGDAVEEKLDFVHIVASNPTAVAPLNMGFEETSFPEVSTTDAGLNWSYDSEETSTVTWERTTDVSKNGNACLVLDNTKASGTHSLISPSIDLTGNTCTNLTFDIAYQRRLKNSRDRLVVYTSTTCGRRWDPTTYDLEGEDLETTGSFSLNPFTPASSDWRTESINLGSSLGTEDRIMFKFELISSNGNKLYLDNVNFGCAALSLEEERAINFSIFPNPSSDDSQLLINTESNENVTINITDLTGKILMSNTYFSSSNGINLSVNNELGYALEAGIYLVNITNGSNTVTKKLIKN